MIKRNYFLFILFAWLIQEFFVVHEQSFIEIVTFVFKRT